MLSLLPPPLARIRVPKLFPVSAVARFRGCKLRLIASTREWRELHLIAGPQAALGRVVHRAYERWTSESGSDPLRFFDEELEREREMLAADPRRAHFSDLAKTRSFVEWRNLRATLKARCARLPKLPSSPAPAGGKRPHGSPRAGAEQWLASDDLRLVGRADLLEPLGTNRLGIRDFKTGRVLDAEGDIRPETSYQLRLYALLVEAACPGRELVLAVDSGGRDQSLTWDAAARTDAKRHLADALDALPAGMEVAATEIARASDECCHCPVRHRCATYLQAAPAWWHQIPETFEAIPADTWGSVIASSPASGLVTIRLKDAADREVTVTGLRDRAGLIAANANERVFFFGLERTGSGIGWTGRPFQPHAFHETPAEQGGRQAWALEIYRTG